MNANLKSIIKKLKPLTQDQIDDIINAGYITGSCAINKETPGSDIDIIISKDDYYNKLNMDKDAELFYYGKDYHDVDCMNCYYGITKDGVIINILVPDNNYIRDQWVFWTETLKYMINGSDTISKACDDKEIRIKLATTLRDVYAKVHVDE